MSVTQSTISIDAMFDNLRNPIRRAILHYLAQPDVDRPVTLDELPVDAPGYLLHHVHLPKLADHDMIMWDYETGTISRGPRFDHLRPILGVLDDLPNSTA